MKREEVSASLISFIEKPTIRKVQTDWSWSSNSIKDCSILPTSLIGSQTKIIVWTDSLWSSNSIKDHFCFTGILHHIPNNKQGSNRLIVKQLQHQKILLCLTNKNNMLMKNPSRFKQIGCEALRRKKQWFKQIDCEAVTASRITLPHQHK